MIKIMPTMPTIKTVGDPRLVPSLRSLFSFMSGTIAPNSVAGGQPQSQHLG
jgi:hypothetical protein